MSIKQLFIPDLLADFSVIELFDLFYIYQIATISEIYYITKEEVGELYNDIYITIREWHHTTMADNFIQKLRNSYAGFIYDNFDDFYDINKDISDSYKELGDHIKRVQASYKKYGK